VILAPQIKHFLDDLSWRLIGSVLRDCFCVLQTSSTKLLVSITPSKKLDRPIPKYRQALRAWPVFSACWSTLSSR
jgi:hypothetical protein